MAAHLRMTLAVLQSLQQDAALRQIGRRREDGEFVATEAADEVFAAAAIL